MQLAHSSFLITEYLLIPADNIIADDPAAVLVAQVGQPAAGKGVTEDRDAPLLLQPHQDCQIIFIAILVEGKVTDDGGGDPRAHPFLGLNGDHVVAADFNNRCPEV